MTDDFICSVALTRGPAGCSGKLGTHLVARRTMPVVTEAVSHHHVVLRVRQAAGHLHRSDGTWKVDDECEGKAAQSGRVPNDSTAKSRTRRINQSPSHLIPLTLRA